MQQGLGTTGLEIALEGSEMGLDRILIYFKVIVYSRLKIHFLSYFPFQVMSHFNIVYWRLCSKITW